MIIEHIGIWVQDLESMLAFYTELLGGASGGFYENPATGFRSYFVSFGEGARLELMCRPGLGPPPVSPCYGYAHIALRLGTRRGGRHRGRRTGPAGCDRGVRGLGSPGTGITRP